LSFDLQQNNLRTNNENYPQDDKYSERKLGVRTAHENTEDFAIKRQRIDKQEEEGEKKFKLRLEVDSSDYYNNKMDQ